MNNNKNKIINPKISILKNKAHHNNYLSPTNVHSLPLPNISFLLKEIPIIPIILKQLYSHQNHRL